MRRYKKQFNFLNQNISYGNTTFNIVKTYFNIFNCFILIFFLISCSEIKIESEKIETKTSTIKWIVGDYKLKSDYGNYFEKWRKIDSLTYSGLGYFLDIENQDTLFRQSMKLHQGIESVFMHFNVKNQNDNKDVEFKLTKQEGKIFTFENPFRDYPSIVTYKILSDTSINVVMYGFKNGKEKREDFIITK